MLRVASGSRLGLYHLGTREHKRSLAKVGGLNSNRDSLDETFVASGR